MIRKILNAINHMLVKFRHPSIRSTSLTTIRPGTEIRIKNGGSLTLGENVLTERRVALSAIGGKMTIGNQVSFNRNDIAICREQITIGNGCSFGPNVCIYDHDHLFNRQGFAESEYRTAPVIIEDHCWIGANVVILRGTHIGPGCVIGAGTVVKGEIPAHSLVRNEGHTVVEAIREDHA